MSSFRTSIEKTLALEGGPSNLANDPGGETRYGIAKHSHPDVDIDALTREQAIEIYRREYWNPLYDRIIDQEVADEIFDFGVNVGVVPSVRIAQVAIRYLTVGPLVVDGVFGEGTLRALDSLSAGVFLREFRAREAYHYAGICINRPDSRDFLLGWFRRVMA